jgi:hypothetical protein
MGGDGSCGHGVGMGHNESQVVVNWAGEDDSWGLALVGIDVVQFIRGDWAIRSLRDRSVSFNHRKRLIKM